MAAMCEDECDKCQSSIDHMYEKIEAQGCNPNTMQKAWDRIREDCDHSESAVGLMAETCEWNSFTARPSCGIPSADMFTNKIHFEMVVTNQTDRAFNIIVNVRDNSSIFEIEPNATSQVVRFWPDDFSITEGDEVEIISEIIPDSGTLREISRSSNTFTFVRNGYWGYLRYVKIITSEETASFEYFNW